MKKVILIAAIIVVSFLSIAWSPCQADQTSWVCPNDDEANGIYWICNYFPLKPNSQWQYTTGEYHIVNDVHTCSSGYSGILHKTSTYEYSSYMQNGADGLLFAGCQYDEGVFEDSGGYFVLVPPQIRLGESIRITTEWGTIDLNIVGLETISVPAGTFTTLKIEWIMKSSGGSSCLSYKTTAWLAKGIGPVKIHRTDANPADCLGCMLVCDPNDDVVRLNTPAELISFDINQEKPKISISPMSVNLGSIRVGSTSNPRTVTIKNTGKGDLIINPITISGINQSEFIESDDCSMVPAKSSCHITVTFTPLPPFVKKTAFMSISSNDPKKPTINVKLLGQAPPPKISVSPKSVNFGTVSDGSTSAPKTVTIKNTGISDLTVNAITFTGTNATEFGQTSNCTTVAKGGSCTISITFSPSSPGNKSAHLDISTNDPKKSNITVKLAGTGSGTGGLFSTADLAGQWEVNSFASGPGAPWWERGIFTVNPNGTFAGSLNENTGSIDNISGKFSISSNGLITLQGDANALFQMDSDKTVIVGTMTWTGYMAGTTGLVVLTRKAAIYSMADLVGTWEMNGLGTPGPWWSRETFTINSDGVISGISHGSDGSTTPMSGTFSITSDGIISAAGAGIHPSFRCVMDSGKSIVVCTNTTFGGQTDMHIFIRKDVSYSMADLVGTWEGNSLASGPCSPWWERLTMTVNEDGSLTMSTVESTGTTQNLTGGVGSISITSDGMLAFHGGGDINLEGRMDAGKTIMVWTGSFGVGCYGGTELKIFTKKAP